MRFIRCLPLLGLAVCLAGPASAQSTIPLTISGNQATGEIDLPGGFAATVTITFESVTGLDSAALEASARIVELTDTDVLSRLPELDLPTGFPVLLSIEPSASSTLSFTGVRTVQLYTYNLMLQTDNPLSLFSAHAGGAFEDVTKSEGMGSYRVDGSGPAFSEFLMVRDTRLIDPVIVSKFDVLETALNASTLPPILLATLRARLAVARALYELGLIPAAITQLNLFSALVLAQSGITIPNVWLAHDPTVNAAGTLRAGADTLRFSLNRKANGAP